MDREKAKIGVVVAVLVLCIGWLVYYFATLPPDPSRNAVQPLNSPAWTWANSVNDKLIQDKRFADTSIIVTGENPEKFKVVGMVHNSSELTTLKSMIGSEAEGKELEWEVGVPGH